jgi:hypothetical protein
MAAAVVASVISSVLVAGATTPTPVKSESQLQSYLAVASKLTSLPDGVQPSISGLANSFATVTNHCLVPPIVTDPIKAWGPIAKCTYGDVKSKRTLVLYGDSHAAMWTNAFSTLGVKDGFRVILLSVGSCEVADIDSWNYSSLASSEGCTAFRNWIPGYVKSLHPFATVVAFIKNPNVETYAQTPIAPSAFESALEKSLRHLLTDSPRVVLLGQQPRLLESSSACLAVHVHSIKLCGVSESSANTGAATSLLSDAATSAHADFVPVLQWFCTTTFCPIEADGVIIYFDQYHITRQYSLLVEHLLAGVLKPDGIS